VDHEEIGEDRDKNSGGMFVVRAYGTAATIRHK